MSQVAHPSREHNKIHNHLVAHKKPVKKHALFHQKKYTVRQQKVAQEIRTHTSQLTARVELKVNKA